jgi:hypothetical protein
MLRVFAFKHSEKFSDELVRATAQLMSRKRPAPPPDDSTSSEEEEEADDEEFIPSVSSSSSEDAVGEAPDAGQLRIVFQPNDAALAPSAIDLSPPVWVHRARGHMWIKIKQPAAQ